MTDEQIRQMVSRFLAWRLPEDFSPDGGISFERTFNGVNGATLRATPSGTNLLNFNQAMDMVRHMTSELAAVQPAHGDYFEGLEEGIKIGRSEPQPDPCDEAIKGLVDAATEALSELEAGGKTLQTVHNLRAAITAAKAVQHG